MQRDTTPPNNLGADASGVSSIPATLAGGLACPDHHFPGIACATCGDDPGTIQAPAPAGPDYLTNKVPFPPVEPAAAWGPWSQGFDKLADHLAWDAAIVARHITRARAASKAAGLAVAMGSTVADQLRTESDLAWRNLALALHNLVGRKFDLQRHVEVIGDLDAMQAAGRNVLQAGTP